MKPRVSVAQKVTSLRIENIFYSELIMTNVCQSSDTDILRLVDLTVVHRRPWAAGEESRKRALHFPLIFHDAYLVLAFKLTHLWKKQNY